MQAALRQIRSARQAGRHNLKFVYEVFPTLRPRGPERGYIIVHGQIEFEGESALALQNNDMVKQYYLGI
jgi:ABC-type lipopolysaccharide export system ATPase subunit